MDEIKIRYTFETLKEKGELIEVRIINGKENFSGYFCDIDTLIDKLKHFNKGNTYFVMNRINPACYSREQRDVFVKNAKNTTSDNDISFRDWILVDVDPHRPTGVSSTNEERKASKEVVEKIYSYLNDKGFAMPVLASSGNGYHLLYRIAMPNDEQSKTMVKTFLMAIDFLFSTNEAKVDTSVFNAARITKLYGTTSRKGLSSDDRPHRISQIKPGMDKPKITPTNLIALIASSIPKPPEPSWRNNYNKEQFDLDSFISKHNIQVRDKHSFTGGEKYILNQCLFNDEHKGKDAAIFKLQNGALAYKCFHDSCSHYSWQDVREMYEPNYRQNGYKDIRNTGKKDEYKPQPETEDKGVKFLSLSQIKSKDRSTIVSIPSGFSGLDSKIIGFNKGEITLWSGKNGSGKSTLINQICLNACNKGYKPLVFSGELPAHKIKHWLHLQAAGRQYNKPSQFDGFFYTPKNIGEKIDEWLDDKLFVYNNDYGNDFEQLMADIENLVDDKGIDCIVLDNLMAMDLLSVGGDKYQQQSRAIIRMCNMVKKKNIHMHIVAHPRKAVGFLRKDDISGTADLSNAVDNVIIVHRVNNDFERAAKDFFPPQVVVELIDYSNVIEVCKNRDLGIVDYMVGLQFEVESKRFLNFKHENIVYQWQDLLPESDLFQKRNESFYEKEEDIKLNDEGVEVPF